MKLWALLLLLVGAEGSSRHALRRLARQAQQHVAHARRQQQGWVDEGDQLDLSSLTGEEDLAAPSVASDDGGEELWQSTLSTLNLSAIAAAPDTMPDTSLDLAKIAAPERAEPFAPSAFADDFDRSGEGPVAVATTTSPPEPDTEIGGLERSVLTLVKQGATPGMVTFLEELQKLVDEKMKKELRTQRQATQSGLDAQFAAVQSCAEEGWKKSLNVSTVAARFTVQGHNLPTLADQHRKCRQKQLEQKEQLQALEDATATQASVEKICGAYNKTEVLRLDPVGDASSCLLGSKFPPESPTRYLDFLKAQRDWWDREHEKIRSSRLQCENATKEHEAHEANIAKAKTALEDQKSNCDKAQAAMDEASCGYKAALQEKCQLISSCEDCNWKTYNETFAAAKQEEKFLQAQMHALLRIDCYLGVFDLGNATEGVLKCKGKDFSLHSNVTSLAFQARDRPDIVACKEDKDNVAGFCAYEGNYYKNTSDLSGPCTASCCTSKSCQS